MRFGFMMIKVAMKKYLSRFKQQGLSDSKTFSFQTFFAPHFDLIGLRILNNQFNNIKDFQLYFIINKISHFSAYFCGNSIKIFYCQFPRNINLI